MTAAFMRCLVQDAFFQKLVKNEFPCILIAELVLPEITFTYGQV